MLEKTKMSDKVKIIIKTVSNEHRLGIKKGNSREITIEHTLYVHCCPSFCRLLITSGSEIFRP